MDFFKNAFHKIQSRDNQKLKFARSVRDGREREYIFVEGLRLCEEILKTDLSCKNCFLTAEFLNRTSSAKIVEDILSKKIEVNEVDAQIFDSLSDTKTSQGIMIIAEKPQTGKEIIERRLSADSFILLLHQINNPSNLGAILRTAEAVGISGVITTKGTTDVFSPKSLRGSMGAGFRLPFWTNADFFSILQWAGDNQIKTICADVKSAKTYTEINWNERKLLIFGSEGHGLTAAEMNATDESLIIPMENSVESLNVAVACGVILFEAKRQKDLIKKGSWF